MFLDNKFRIMSSWLLILIISYYPLNVKMQKDHFWRDYKTPLTGSEVKIPLGGALNLLETQIQFLKIILLSIRSTIRTIMTTLGIQHTTLVLPLLLCFLSNVKHGRWFPRSNKLINICFLTCLCEAHFQALKGGSSLKYMISLFLAPSGAQGVTILVRMSVRSSGSNLYKVSKSSSFWLRSILGLS